MSTSSSRMLVLIAQKFACIKISGRANFNSSIDFKILLNELLQKGFITIVLDLSECVLMDSTFLGVLAGFGLKMVPGNNGAGPAAIELLNPNTRITELLENLGVLHLFNLNHGALKLAEGTETLPHSAPNPTREEVTRACLDAHKTLMEINPDNVPKFKEVTLFLAEDLKKLKSGG